MVQIGSVDSTSFHLKSIEIEMNTIVQTNTVFNGHEIQGCRHDGHF